MDQWKVARAVLQKMFRTKSGVSMMVWWMVFSGVCFFGGFYVGMVMMALMSAAKKADEEMGAGEYVWEKAQKWPEIRRYI